MFKQLVVFISCWTALTGVVSATPAVEEKLVMCATMAQGAFEGSKAKSRGRDQKTFLKDFMELNKESPKEAVTAAVVGINKGFQAPKGTNPMELGQEVFDICMSQKTV